MTGLSFVGYDVVEVAPAYDGPGQVTALFADVVGSTALAGSEDPERTRALLERFYDAMTDLLDTHLHLALGA